MTVYAIVQMKTRDGDVYNRYQSRISKILPRFDGEVVVADDNPIALEGDSNFDKCIVLSFPNELEFRHWENSDECKMISRDRMASTEGTAILVNKLEEPRGEQNIAPRFYADEILSITVFVSFAGFIGLLVLSQIVGSGASIAESVAGFDILIAVFVTAAIAQAYNLFQLRRYRP